MSHANSLTVLPLRYQNRYLEVNSTSILEPKPALNLKIEAENMDQFSIEAWNNESISPSRIQ